MDFSSNYMDKCIVFGTLRRPSPTLPGPSSGLLVVYAYICLLDAMQEILIHGGED